MARAGYETNAPLAEDVGVAESTVGRWLKGTPPDIDKLRKLSVALDLSVLELLVASGHIEPQEADLSARPIAPDATYLELQLAKKLQQLPPNLRDPFVELIDNSWNAAVAAQAVDPEAEAAMAEHEPAQPPPVDPPKPKRKPPLRRNAKENQE